MKTSPEKTNNDIIDLDQNLGDQSVGTAPEEKRFDASRWGSGSDGHLYDFAKRCSC